jgi:hypothetical protein
MLDGHATRYALGRAIETPMQIAIVIEHFRRPDTKTLSLENS